MKPQVDEVERLGDRIEWHDAERRLEIMTRESRRHGYAPRIRRKAPEWVNPLVVPDGFKSIILGPDGQALDTKKGA